MYDHILNPMREFLSNILHTQMITQQSLKSIDEHMEDDWNYEHLINQDEPEIKQFLHDT